MLHVLRLSLKMEVTLVNQDRYQELLTRAERDFDEGMSKAGTPQVQAQDLLAVLLKVATLAFILGGLLKDK